MRYLEEIEREINESVELAFPSHAGIKYINIATVIELHFHVVDVLSSPNEKPLYGVKSHDLLSSAIARQVTGFGGRRKWETVYEVGATLFYGLIKNHAFNDVNKRTALMSLIYFLHLNNIAFDTSKCNRDDLDDIAVRVAESSVKSLLKYKKYRDVSDEDVVYLARWIKKNTMKLEFSYKPVTYNDIRGPLERLGYSLRRVNIGIILTHLSGGKENILMEFGTAEFGSTINPNKLKGLLEIVNKGRVLKLDISSLINETESIVNFIDEFRVPLERLKHR